MSIPQPQVRVDDQHLLLVVNVLCAIPVFGAFFLSALMQFSWFSLWFHSELFPVQCVFKLLSHLPCATCGLTRAMLMIAQGRYVDAFNYNLLSIPVFMGAVAFMLTSLIRPDLALRGLRSMMRWQVFGVVAILLVLAWVFKLTSPHRYW